MYWLWFSVMSVGIEVDIQNVVRNQVGLFSQVTVVGYRQDPCFLWLWVVGQASSTRHNFPLVIVVHSRADQACWLPPSLGSVHGAYWTVRGLLQGGAFRSAALPLEQVLWVLCQKCSVVNNGNLPCISRGNQGQQPQPVMFGSLLDSADQLLGLVLEFLLASLWFLSFEGTLLT